MSQEIDDSALIHGGTYDPAKAREYYLRTRHLKGRRRGAARPSPSRPIRANQIGPHANSSKARAAEIEAQRAALEKRLDRLREVLRELVDAAKKRSGVDESKDTPKDKADRNEKKKREKPLTASEKRKKAKADKERREKENKPTSEKDLEDLQAQIKEIRAKIKDALEDARKKAANHSPKTASKGR